MPTWGFHWSTASRSCRCHLASKREHTEKWHANKFWRYQSNILLVCRQINQEVTEFFYQNTIIFVKTPFDFANHFHRGQEPWTLSRLHHIKTGFGWVGTVTFPEERSRTNVESLRDTLRIQQLGRISKVSESYPELRTLDTLTIDFAGHNRESHRLDKVDESVKSFVPATLLVEAVFYLRRGEGPGQILELWHNIKETRILWEESLKLAKLHLSRFQLYRKVRDSNGSQAEGCNSQRIFTVELRREGLRRSEPNRKELQDWSRRMIKMRTRDRKARLRSEIRAWRAER